MNNVCPICWYRFDPVMPLNECPRCQNTSKESELVGEEFARNTTLRELKRGKIDPQEYSILTCIAEKRQLQAKILELQDKVKEYDEFVGRLGYRYKDGKFELMGSW